MVHLLKIPVTDEVLELLGFSDYDDEHCTWGNRRLRFGDKDNWYALQILDYGDWPEENGRPEGFAYSGWFELIQKFKPLNKSGTVDDRVGWDLLTVRDIYKVIYLYHREWLPDFKIKIQLLEKS